ncbi:MAG: hypothetical protein IPM23_19610 [Candidatus Melainabacteria bacterium]|nr:hypothetical protein [Candidatus Melainabacteria bacterium]
MEAPQSVSYQTLLAYLEDRLWIDAEPDQFAYLVDLVDDLYCRVEAAEVARFSGSLKSGSLKSGSLQDGPAYHQGRF